VTFAFYDETFARTIPLNDHIFLYSDPGLGAVWGITLYSYSRLLEVSETELPALRDLSEEQVQACFNLLARPPASPFFDLTYPDQLIARVKSPGLISLIHS